MNPNAYVVTSIKRQISKHGGLVFMVTFRGTDKKSHLTWVVEQYRNFKRWEPIIKAGVGAVLSGVSFTRKGLVDADSPVTLIGQTGE